LHFYQINQIKRVRLIKRADGVYVQFCIDVDRKENTEPSGNSIGLDNDASWYQFRVWIEYFGKIFERVTVAVNPQYTSQECSNCGENVKNLI
jgi:Putative transposase DNA-binding domain